MISVFFVDHFFGRSSDLRNDRDHIKSDLTHLWPLVSTLHLTGFTSRTPCVYPARNFLALSAWLCAFLAIPVYETTVHDALTLSMFSLMSTPRTEPTFLISFARKNADPPIPHPMSRTLKIICKYSRLRDAVASSSQADNRDLKWYFSLE